MPVAAVIVTHRCDALVDACVQSLLGQTRVPDDILVVVSSEGRPAVPSGARALHLGANLGYARAANAGAEATTGDLLLLNDDTRLLPDAVARLEAARGAEGAYVPRIRLADGSGRLDNQGHGVFPDGFVWARGRDTIDDGRALLPPGAFSGAAVWITRSAWRATGGYDPRFDSFGEDVDLSLRFLRRGFVIRAVPEALVEHHLGATYGRFGPDKIRRIERNRVRAAVRSLPVGLLLTLPLWTGARLAVFAALAASGRGPGASVPPEARRAAVQGLVEGMADAPTWWRDRTSDAPEWALGERAMLRAMWDGRARWEDVWRASGS